MALHLLAVSASLCVSLPPKPKSAKPNVQFSPTTTCAQVLSMRVEAPYYGCGGNYAAMTAEEEEKKVDNDARVGGHGGVGVGGAKVERAWGTEERVYQTAERPNATASFD